MKRQILNTVIESFVDTARKYPSRTALVVDNLSLTYKDLYRQASRVAKIINDNSMIGCTLASVFAYRSESAYIGILGILLSGKGYVPLSPKFPIERTIAMQNLSRSRVIVAGKECMHMLPNILPKIKLSQLVILPDSKDIRSFQNKFSRHYFVTLPEAVSEPGELSNKRIDLDSIAYLMFTSGSTGIPKGVPVSHGSLASYIRYFCQTHKINAYDRFSQMFDLTFDLSVHDMFVCWVIGAALYCVPEAHLMAPARFIGENSLTVWFAVPSVGILMSKMGLLKTGAFKSLRYSLFCGESLSVSTAKQWQRAAPYSVIENLYGPTEATIAVSYYRWDDKNSPKACLNDIVPIGKIFNTQQYCIITQGKKVISNDGVGELCLSGPQITKGYLNDKTKTKQRYMRIKQINDSIWYKTGDVVKEDKNHCLHYLGRIDNQIKIMGYRVDLEEVDSVVKRVTSEESVCSVAWPPGEGCIRKIITFIYTRKEVPRPKILNACSKYLPGYMVPSEICKIEHMPVTINGKVDRKKLLDLLTKDRA